MIDASILTVEDFETIAEDCYLEMTAALYLQAAKQYATALLDTATAEGTMEVLKAKVSLLEGCLERAQKREAKKEQIPE